MLYSQNTKRRINITLPETTIHQVDRTIERGERSRLIDIAVRFYLREIKRNQLRRQLKAGALARANRDQQLTNEWFAIEHEV